jgi:hypothetical protein
LNSILFEYGLTKDFGTRTQYHLPENRFTPQIESLKDFKKINLDSILAFNQNSLSEWAYQQLYQMNSYLQNKEKEALIKSLQEVVLERKYLDNYLSLSNTPVSQTRLKIFRRLCLVSREHFPKEFGNQLDPFSSIRDEEILLETFVKFAMLNNDYYHKVNVKQVIFKNKAVFGLVREGEFLVRFRDIDSVVCQSGKRELYCIQGRLGVFFAITFFIWHMKEFHYDFISKKDKKNELLFLIKHLDISK